MYLLLFMLVFLMVQDFWFKFSYFIHQNLNKKKIKGHIGYEIGIICP